MGEEKKGRCSMTKTQLVQQEMMKALKERQTERKAALSLLLSALKAAGKDARRELTEAEEDAIIQKEIKQTRETMESAPASRTDILEECRFRIGVLSEFAPEEMSEEQIRAAIAAVLEELGIDAPAPKDKGVIMKTLMPRVRGKADGAVVNRLVAGLFNG